MGKRKYKPNQKWWIIRLRESGRAKILRKLHLRANNQTFYVRFLVGQRKTRRRMRKYRILRGIMRYFPSINNWNW